MASENVPSFIEKSEAAPARVEEPRLTGKKECLEEGQEGVRNKNIKETKLNQSVLLTEEQLPQSLDSISEIKSVKEVTELQNAAIQIKSTIQQTLESHSGEKDTLVSLTQDKIAALQKTLIDTTSEPSSNLESLPSFNVDLKVESLLDKNDSLIELVESSVTSDLASAIPEVPKVPKEPTKVKNEPSSNNKIRSSNSSPLTSSKRKGEKTTDQVMKWLSQCTGTTEDKLKLLCKKCVEALDESKSFENKLKQSEKQAATLMKEKEQLQTEQSKLLLIRSRLEGLCRELQRQNKAIKDESLLRLREEEEKRKEIANKFQSTLNDITNLTQENQQRNAKLKEENDELARKLKDLIEHYEVWEKHSEKINQQKELECELAKAKLTQSQLQLRQEQESHLMVKQELLYKLESLQNHCNQLIKAEFQVRGELAAHLNKFEEYQTEVSNSNKVISTFSSDMEKMIKKVKSLEKESVQWKSRCDSANRALIEMAAEKQKRDQEMLNLNQKLVTLEKLCRALQIERNTLRSQIKPGLNSQVPEIATSANSNLAAPNIETSPLEEVKTEAPKEIPNIKSEEVSSV